MSDSALFFPTIRRLGGYPIKDDGSYYVYTKYRTHIAEDCAHRCVYCDSHEAEMGGPELMQLDHFRPESRVEFAHLRNDPLNLHYACGRCNLLKSDHWPAIAPDKCREGEIGFVDPFTERRSDYFRIESDGRIVALCTPAPYLIELLHLGREHLRKLREIRILKARLRRKFEDDKAYVAEAISAGRPIAPEKVQQIIETCDQILVQLELY